MQESMRRLTALADANEENPVILRVIFLRNLLISSSLRQQVAPLQTAANIVDGIQKTLEDIRQGLPALAKAGNDEAVRNSWTLIDEIAVQSMLFKGRIESDMAPANRVLKHLDTQREAILTALPALWRDYYFSGVKRLTDPQQWADLPYWWHQMLFNLPLRLSIEFPPTPSAWKQVSVHFFNVLALGFLLLFFAHRILRRREQAGKISAETHKDLCISLLWQFLGLAVIAASFGGQGEQYRGLLTLGSMATIAGEIKLAWCLRCIKRGDAPSPSPLWPVYIASAGGIALSYPNMPVLLLNIAWIILCAITLIAGQRKKQELPALESVLLRIHKVFLWLSLFMALVGWPRLSMLLFVIISCLLVSLQCVVALVQLLNGSMGNTEKVQHMLQGLLAAFIAPTVLLLITGAVLLWIVAMPGGTLLTWHYLAEGIEIGTTSFNLLHLFAIVSAFYLTRAGISAMHALLYKLNEQADNIDKTLLHPIKTGISYGLWTLFALFSLKLLGFGLDNLAVIAGGLSVGIGFGMQAIVNNFVSGMILIFSRSMHEGDIVDVGGLMGTVRKISVRATVVETLDNAVIFVPNSEFVSSRLINWTRNGKTVRREVVVGVAYGTDPEMVEKLLLQIAKETTGVAHTPKPTVLFSDFADSTLNFTLRFWTDIHKAMDVASRLRHSIAKTFEAHHVEIAFPQLDVHIVPASDAPAQVKAE